MNQISVGDMAPDFTLPTDGGGTFTLSSLLGNKFILYFYPKDDTSGCTSQAQQFTADIKQFDAFNTKVFGLSKDSVKSHDKFKSKYDLKIALISDEGLEAANAYGVWVEKSMYGRKYMGMERATYLIDENGKIAKIWRKVKINGHIREILEAVRQL